MKASHFAGKLSSANLCYCLILLLSIVLLMKTQEMTLEEQIPIITRTKYVRDSE